MFGARLMRIADDTQPFGPPLVRVAGDMGILVEFGAQYHPKINNAVMSFEARFIQDLPAGIIETVPTFRSLLVRFDPLELSFDRLSADLHALLAESDWYAAPPPEDRKRWVLPVVYGGTRGPNLPEVADLMGLREDQVVDSHAAADLTVAMLGFAPGLAYLGQLPELWQFPRRTEITPKVPAGAVLAAVRQIVLPCTDIPTGWHQIGQTPFRGFDVAAQPPFLLSPGDQIRFEPVQEAGYAKYDMQAVRREAGV